MAAYIDLSEKHGHRNDHGFACGAEFNVKIRRRLNIPDFVREQLSEGAIDEIWWEDARQARDSLKDALSRSYKWIGDLAFVGRGPGWLAIEDTGCRPRNWDTIGKVVDQYLKNFIKSMEDPKFWRDIKGVTSNESSTVRHSTRKASSARNTAPRQYATKKKPAQLQREIDEALARSDTSAPRMVMSKGRLVAPHGYLTDYKTGEQLRPATADEERRSRAAAKRDGGSGVIKVDGLSTYVS